MKQRINCGVEIQVLQITHKLNWALAVGKGIWQLHEVKKKSFDFVDIRTQAFRITVFGYFLDYRLRYEPWQKPVVGN